MDIKNNIKIIPVASPIYSLGLLALGTLPLLSVRIEGLNAPGVHEIEISVFGLSKAGFFIERTPAFSGEIITEKGSDGVTFNLTSVSYRIKDGFFRTLKSQAAGKISVEVTIDGVKHMGDAPVMLFPSNIYPATATPNVFATLLSPFCKDVERIVSGADGRDFLSLYSAVKNERIIYSVRECDFTARNVSFDDVNSFYTQRSKMASSLEMALIFCSCALRMGLYPVIITLKGKKAPSVLCGVASVSGLFSTVSASADTLRTLCSEGKIDLINVSCLFTGHSIELEDAIHSAEEELFASEMIFALDIMSAYSEGAELCHFDELSAEAEKSFTADIRKKNVKQYKTKTLSDHAEYLTDTSASPLLNIATAKGNFVPANAGGFGAIMKAARSGEEMVLTDTDAGVAKGGMGELYETCRRLRLKGERYGELYLACGFLAYKGSLAPLALYPITITCKNAGVTVKFNSHKAYCNRLLCEKLKSIAACKKFFDNVGIPGGDLDDLISCFESLCATVPGDFRLIKECGIGLFPYRNSVLSFAIVDKYDKIASDSLSCAILSGKRVATDNESVPYGKGVCDIELRSPKIFCEAVLEATSHASCRDVIVKEADSTVTGDVSLSVASENLRIGKPTLIVSQSAKEREAIEKAFEEAGLSGACITLARGIDIKKSISEKLTALSETDLINEPENDISELLALQEKLSAYYRSKNKKYDFGFSFDEAARAYINAGSGLSAEEKAVQIEHGSIFFPELSRESANELFRNQLELCRAASVLPKMPYKDNPFFRASLTDGIDDTDTFRFLADKALGELSELVESCREIAQNAKLELSDIKTLPALHAFLSLMVLVSKEYDSGITPSLLSQDAYSVSKKLAELRSAATKIISIEKELCEFDREIFTLEAESLLEEWNEGETSHSDISKTINAFRTEEATEGTEKKSVFEVLGLLDTHKKLCNSFEEDSIGMNETFAGYWNGVCTDWKKVTSIVDFTKMADVLLKKIYGTDTDKRRMATKSFPVLSEYCAKKTSIASVIGAASLFDKMFSDDGSIVKVASKLSADLYNMSFDDGIFSEHGIGSTVKGWIDAADMIPLAAQYNKCASICKKLGLSSFVHYLENNAYTSGTAKIFTRSLLFLALKQMTLYDKGFAAMNLYEDDMKRYLELLEENCRHNRKKLSHIYISACVAHIRNNSARAKAFSEGLSDKGFTAEELILRNSETVKTLFPVIIAEPSFALLSGEAENLIICSADTVDTSTVLPILHLGSHKIVLSGSEKLTDTCESFALDCKKANVFSVYAGKDSFGGISHTGSITYLRSPVSSYDKERSTNVLEAQTIGLEIMKELSVHPEKNISVLAFTENQCEAINEVLTAVAEKSVPVQRAISNGNICISCADKNAPYDCDVLYISTVFDKDESSGMCMTCAEHDRPENDISGLPIPAVRALFGSAEKTVAVFSFAPSKYPAPAGALGAMRMALFADYAVSGGNFTDPENSCICPYTLEFARLMSQNGFDVYTMDSGSYCIIYIGGNSYAAIIGKKRCTLSEHLVLRKKGVVPLFIDTTELLLNPQKIIDRINSIKNGGGVI